jgi:nucleotide-binding universal stress UspA family protein
LRILVAYDGSPPAEAAVDEVASRPWPPGTKVRLVTVLDPIPAASPEAVGVYVPVLERIRASIREKAYERIHAALRKLERRPELEASCEVRDGGVTSSLLDAIREWNADLVVAGSNGKTGVAMLFLGSVSHALVTHAPCNIEIVRAKPGAA